MTAATPATAAVVTATVGSIVTVAVTLSSSKGESTSCPSGR
jgi:hypothetical protein